MTYPIHGYRSGPRVIVPMPVDASSADIKPGDMIGQSQTDGYATQAAAGNKIIGFAVSLVDNPTADGGATVMVDTSRESIYEYPPDAGSVTQAIVGDLLDVGGAQSIDIDATVDNALECVRVDVDANTCFVKRNASLE